MASIIDPEALSLRNCIGCGSCTDACPSARNGGIDPMATVEAVLEGNDPGDVWRCLMCHRCTDACASGVNVAGLMLALRHAETESGNIPKRFQQTRDAVARDGRTSWPQGRMAKARTDLGLPEVKP